MQETFASLEIDPLKPSNRKCMHCGSYVSRYLWKKDHIDGKCKHLFHIEDTREAEATGHNGHLALSGVHEPVLPSPPAATQSTNSHLTPPPLS
jgi:hypothetical protein